MARKFTIKLTKEELAGAIAYAFSKSSENTDVFKAGSCSDALDFLKGNGMRTGQITPTIVKDLYKVEFSEENLEWENDTGYAGLETITGFNTLPNGLSYLGICCGGDWEQPLFYIVYYDGLKLRGYIPTEGNHWNTDKNSAYGNDHADDNSPDNQNAKKRFNVDDIEELGDMNPAVLLADIENHITFNIGKFVKPKSFADIK